MRKNQANGVSGVSRIRMFNNSRTLYQHRQDTILHLGESIKVHFKTHPKMHLGYHPKINCFKNYKSKGLISIQRILIGTTKSLSENKTRIIANIWKTQTQRLSWNPRTNQVLSKTYSKKSTITKTSWEKLMVKTKEGLFSTTKTLMIQMTDNAVPPSTKCQTQDRSLIWAQ